MGKTRRGGPTHSNGAGEVSQSKEGQAEDRKEAREENDTMTDTTKPGSALARLAEILTDPSSIRGLTSDEIDVLRSVVSSIHTALGGAFIAAKQREMTAAANPKQSLDPLMDVAEVAKLLDLTKAAVYRLIRSGDLKGVEIGKYKKVPVSAFMDYLWRLKQAGDVETPARVEAFVEHGTKLIRDGAVAKLPRGKRHGHDSER